MHTPNFLVYQIYEKGWLSNQIFSLDIAIGLAHQTNRTLVICGKNSSKNVSYIDAVVSGNGFNLKNTAWYQKTKDLPPYNPTTILDLYESFPVKVLNVSEFDYSNKEKNTTSLSSGLTPGTCFTSNEVDSSNLDLRHFSHRRKILTNPNTNIWNIFGTNLSSYSIFFYDKNSELKKCFSEMKLLNWIHQVANKICLRLGKYNSCHIRLSDFDKFLPQSKNYNEAITDVISKVVDDSIPLVVFSEEDSSFPFFTPLKNQFKNIIFLDDFCKTECNDIWRESSWINECIIALVYQYVLSNSEIFLGTPGSTFSALIHRMWALNTNNKNFYYIHSGIRGSKNEVDNYFKDGLFLETKTGPYTWNRIDSNKVIHVKNSFARLYNCLQWYREWPECIIN